MLNAKTPLMVLFAALVLMAPAAVSFNPSSVTVEVGEKVEVALNGTAPTTGSTDTYEITTAPNSTYAKAGISGKTLTVEGVKATPTATSCTVTHTYSTGRRTTTTETGTLSITVKDPPPPKGRELSGGLRISEVCPKPQRRREPAAKYEPDATVDEVDLNGVPSGWIELVNAGDEDVDLSGYKLQVVKRGKEAKTKDFGSTLVAGAVVLKPGERVVVYTTEGYLEGGMFAEPLMDEEMLTALTAGEKTGIVASELVLSAKINPKKFPMVRLMKGLDKNATVVDTVIVPADTPDGCSVVALDPEEDGVTRRYIVTSPTPGAANAYAGRIAVGPQVGPLYGTVKHSLSDLDPQPPAKANEDYEVVLDVNPVFGGTEKDGIASVTLVYRTDVNSTATAEIPMSANGLAYDESGHGQRWAAKIPADKLPKPGMLIQWKARITDAGGNTWTSPAFNDKNNGYEWYGTVVDPGVGESDGQNSRTLPTLHMFVATGNASYPQADLPGKSSTKGDQCMMNLDYDEVFIDPTTKSGKSAWAKAYPYGARCAIYDFQTSNYYDNVRIDCRGNSSDDYYKRSHGLRFSKLKAYRLAEPFNHPVSGEKIEEVRKTSLHGEFNDPAMFRQRMSFWFLNAAGVPAPWENPKRVNLNGKFYQFAYETPRFSEELLCDFYGFNENGYGYKNVGSLHLWNNNSHYGQSGSSADAGTKKKTPDDGDEYDHAELLAFHKEIEGVSNIKNSAQYPNDTTGLDNATVTKKVVEKFDLPAWINYLAATKITQEGDDAWGNLSAYYDNFKLLDGTVCGTGTWRPIAWDLNCAWGQFYTVHVGNIRTGLHADQDWNKCHPLYGGMRIWGYSSSTTTTGSQYGTKGANYGFEAVFQSTKFRRLFLRRLRTLMDAYLKPTDTSEDATPIAVQMKAYAHEIQAEAVKDRGIWGHLGTTSGNKDCDWVNCWGTSLVSAGGKQPDDPQRGYTDIWNNYIVPRRVHLYTTHSIDNTSKGVGYALNKSAGIPHAQSAFLDLRDQITIRADEATGSVVIENRNNETVDISGWKVSGPVVMTLPPGTVIDQGTEQTPGELYVTADRRTTIAKMTLTDQVVVGNGEAGEASAKPRLVNDAGEPVYPLSVNVEVTTSGKGTGTVTGAGEYDFGSTVTLTATPATGSHFTKWTFADETESEENPLVLKNLQGAVTVDAKFKVNSYSVKYDPNGGEGEIEPGKGDYGSKYETAECAFTKAGKVCTGWGTNGVDGLVFVCEPGEKVTNLAIEDGAEVTLYAMWEPKMPVPDDSAEVTTNLTLSVGETVVFTNRYRKNLRFWLLGLDGAGECVKASLNLPTNACEQYRGYVARSTFKTNEVIVTITGKVKGEESIFLGRQYKSKEPRCAIRYTVIVE